MSSRNQNPDDELVSDQGSRTELLDDVRTLYRGIAALLAVALVIVAAAWLYWWLTRTTTGELDQLINENLRPGATPEEIFAFLDAKGLDHGPIDRAGEYSVLGEAGYHEETMVISAIARNTSRFIIGNG